MVAVQISKSDYMMFLRHPAWLWLKKHDKDKLPPPDDNLQGLFDAGNKFEKYAESLYPGGKRIGFTNYAEYLSLPKRTTDALEAGAKSIFQGRFEYKNLTFICDVIEIVDGKLIDLTEIKASTKAKIDHQLDLAFQLVVLEGCGYTVRKISVVHVNNQYVRKGEIDPHQLTARTDVTDSVKALREQTKRNIAAALKVVSEPVLPDPSPARCKLGSTTEWLKIYRELVDVGTGSIYELTRLDPVLVGLLEQNNITKLREIPENLINNGRQQLQLQAVKSGQPVVQLSKIKGFLNKLEYPLFFFDYETLSGVVPYFDGMKPYAQYPFQFSLHKIEHPGGELQHTGYLHANNSNPTVTLSQVLMQQIGKSGSVITWSMSFEKSCNTTLGTMLPEYKEFFASINTRIVDLMLPFSKGWYADAGFSGSASIKNVMPVLAPSLSYKSLGIQDGGSAQRLWMEAIRDGTRGDEKDSILADLDKYCELDTLAMVEILNFLTRLTGMRSVSNTSRSQPYVGENLTLGI